MALPNYATTVDGNDAIVLRVDGADTLYINWDTVSSAGQNRLTTLFDQINDVSPITADGTGPFPGFQCVDFSGVSLTRRTRVDPDTNYRFEIEVDGVTHLFNFPGSVLTTHQDAIDEVTAALAGIATVTLNGTDLLFVSPTTGPTSTVTILASFALPRGVPQRSLNGGADLFEVTELTIRSSNNSWQEQFTVSVFGPSFPDNAAVVASGGGTGDVTTAQLNQVVADQATVDAAQDAAADAEELDDDMEQAQQNDRLEALESKIILGNVVDPSENTGIVAVWRNVNNNQQRFVAPDYYVTTDPTTPGHQSIIDIPEGQTVDVYIVGRQYVNSGALASTAVLGSHYEITNTDGVLTAVEVGNMFVPTSTFTTTSYNDLTSGGTGTTGARIDDISLFFHTPEALPADFSQLHDPEPQNDRLTALENVLGTSSETLLFRHNISAGVWPAGDSVANFNSSASDPASADRYSILDTLEDYRRPDGSIRLRLVYPTLNTYVVFEQSNNFIDDLQNNTGANNPTDFRVIEVVGPILAAGNTSGFRGFNAALGQSNAQIDGTTNLSNWWYPLGAAVLFQSSGLPAYPPVTNTDIIEVYGVLDGTVDLNELSNRVDAAVSVLQTPTPFIGQLVTSAFKTPAAGILWMGDTYNWSDNPILQSLHAASPTDYITDNGDGTFTVTLHADFIRPGLTDIGLHVNDTTAVNGLRYTEPNSPTSTQVNNGGGNTIRGRTGSRPLTGGDPETAPNHRTAYFGIYGDQAI